MSRPVLAQNDQIVCSVTQGGVVNPWILSYVHVFMGRENCHLDVALLPATRMVRLFAWMDEPRVEATIDDVFSHSHPYMGQHAK